MEQLPFTIDQETNLLHIEGFPDAVNVVKLQGRDPRRLADLMLHLQDLTFAADCLGQLSPADRPTLLTEVHWRSAIIHYAKCFGTGKRSQISADKVYKGEQAFKADHAYILTLRNEHLAHDERTHTFMATKAIIAKPGKAFKVEKVVTQVFDSVTFNALNFGKLEALVSRARVWVKEEYDRVAQRITAVLENEVPHDVLSKVPGIEILDTKKPIADS